MKTLKLLMFFLMPWLVANLSLATTQLTLGGYTAPLSSVSGVEGGNIFFTTVSNTNGWFVSISTDDGLVGDHSIDIYSVDSSSFGTSITTVTPTCTLGSNTVLTNILLSPSISLVLPSVRQGYPLQLLGSAKPNCTVTISTIAPLLQYTTVSSTNGTWAYALDTTSYAGGDYQGYSVVEDSILGTSVNSPNVNFSVRASINWIGATDGDVTNPDNYDNGGNLPTAGDLVIYSAGTTPNTGIAPSGVNWVFGGGSTLDGATLFGDVLFSGGGGVNSGTITGFATFGDTCYNQGTVNGDAYFTGVNYSTATTTYFNPQQGTVSGNTIFSGANVVFTLVSGETWGVDASAWLFTNGVPSWAFGASSANGGVILGQATFDGAVNNSGAYAGNNDSFINSSQNSGIVGTNAVFSSAAQNIAGGAVGDYASFWDTSYNSGSVGMYSYFTGSSYNNGTVDLYATFDSSAYNIGHVGDDFVNQSSSTISYAGYWGMTAPIPPASNVLYGVSFGQQQVGTMPAGSGGGINGSAILGMP